jgi:hypothetical protein
MEIAWDSEKDYFLSNLNAGIATFQDAEIIKYKP